MSEYLIEKFVVTYEEKDDLLNENTRYDWQDAGEPEFSSFDEAIARARQLPVRRGYMEKNLPLNERAPLSYRIKELSDSKVFAV